MKRLKNFFNVFTMVVTCVTFASAAFISAFFKGDTLDWNILWQILFVSFLCSIWVIFYPEREISRKKTLILNVLHYILVNVVVLGCGLMYGWFSWDNFPQVLGMVIMIALIFLLVTVISWRRSLKEAEVMNERLRAYQEKKNE